jgi:uncharacterized protein (DUF2236 family)
MELGMTTDGFFGPGATIRAVLGEPVVAVHCGLVCALDMSVDPKWLAAFRQHPGWDEQDAVLSLLTAAKADDAMVFGDRAEAQRGAEVLHRMYEAVRGSLLRDAGPHPAGTPYRASAPEAQRLFLASRFDGYVRAYELGVGRLSTAERAALWVDLRTLADKSGLVSSSELPGSLGDLEDYLEGHFEQAQDLSEHRHVVGATVFRPTARRSVRAVQRAARGIVDERVRAAWGLEWSDKDRLWLCRYSLALTWMSRVTRRGPSTWIYKRVERRIRRRTR